MHHAHGCQPHFTFLIRSHLYIKLCQVLVHHASVCATGDGLPDPVPGSNCERAMPSLLRLASGLRYYWKFAARLI